MSFTLDAYTADGLLAGVAATDGRLVDLLAGSTTVDLDGAVLLPFDGPPERADGRVRIDIDDLLAVVAGPESVPPFHASWHPMTVEAASYRISGELPATPGFDPGRALARPTGPFILLGHVTVALRSHGVAAGQNEHALLWINRYAVEAVVGSLELGFFFPGARSSVEGHAIA